MDLNKIAKQYLRGLTIEKFGPDFEQKQAMGEAQLETERARPGLIDLQKQQAESAMKTQGAQLEKVNQELAEAKMEADEMKRLFGEGKVSSTNVKVSEFNLKQKESEARILSEQSQARAAGALEGERRVQTERTRREMGNLPTPDEARRGRELREKYLGAQTGAVEALGMQRGEGKQFAGQAVPQDVWAELVDEAKANIPEPQGGFGPDWLVGGPDPAEMAEYKKMIEAEVQRLAKARGYLNRGGTGTVPTARSGSPAASTGGAKIIRDAQGNQFMELPNGAKIPMTGGPVRPESAGQFLMGTPEEDRDF